MHAPGSSINKSTPPIFIVGHSRSGSTLLASLLGRHTNLLALPETHFFNSSYAGNVFRRFISQKQPNSYFEYIYTRNVRIQDLKIDKDALKQAFSAKSIKSPREALNLVFEMSLANSDKKRVIEKTPRHIEYINKILQWYPDAKVICILRDGRDAVASLLDAPWTHSHDERHVAYWRWCVHEAFKQQANYPDNVKIVRFEDLVTSPIELLAGLCDFINEDFEEGMLNPSNTVQTVPTWEAQWKEASTREVKSDALYKWRNRSKVETEKWESWMLDELKLLGHPSTGVTEKPNSLLYSRKYSDYIYDLWRLYRTHIAERGNMFRRAQIKRENVVK